MAVCLLSGGKSKLVVDRYTVQNAVTILSQTKTDKQNQIKKNTQANKPNRREMAGRPVM